MEGGEVIVEAYVRLVRKWFTITNIVCQGNKEIDILAFDYPKKKCYQIESSISVDTSFSALHAKPLKKTKDKADKRRSIYYFKSAKFYDKDIQKKIRNEYSINEIQPVIVTWSANKEAKKVAKKYNIQIWYLPEILAELIHYSASVSQHLREFDRVIQLIGRSMNPKMMIKFLYPLTRVEEKVSEIDPFELLKIICARSLKAAEEEGRKMVKFCDFASIMGTDELCQSSEFLVMEKGTNE